LIGGLIGCSAEHSKDFVEAPFESLLETSKPEYSPSLHLGFVVLRFSPTSLGLAVVSMHVSEGGFRTEYGVSKMNDPAHARLSGAMFGP
jgi:hypothetical protein